MLRRLLRRPAAVTPAGVQPKEPEVASAVVGDEGFVAALRASSLLTIVDFWAEWCQPCDLMAAWVEHLARDFPLSLRVLALDVDENPATPERYAVMGLPTLIFFRDGVEVHRTVGVTTYQDLRRQTEKLLVTDEK